MSNDNPIKRPPRAPNKSGYAPKSPVSRPGRKLNANNIGPWAQLLAMYRVQNGETSRRVCAELGISTATMARWQERWAGDVVHFKPQIQQELMTQAMSKLSAIKRLITQHLNELQKLQDQMTGDNGHYRIVRDAAKHIPPSKMPKSWQLAKDALAAQRQRP